GLAARPINIWREHSFITNPCQLPSRAATTLASQDLGVSSMRDEFERKLPQRRSGQPTKPAKSAKSEPTKSETAAAAGVHESDSATLTDGRTATPTIARPADATHSIEPVTVGTPDAPPPTELVEAETTRTPDAPPPTERVKAETTRTPDTPPPTERVEAQTTPSPAARGNGKSARAQLIASAAAGASADAGPRAKPTSPHVAAVPYSQVTGPVRGIARWLGCFAEELRPIRRLVGLATGRPWRLHAAAGNQMLTDLASRFVANPAADRTLAIIGDPADERSRETAIRAARDAISTGTLVVFTTSPAFTGFFASLHAEHPSIGITVLRLPSAIPDVAAIPAIASAEPGMFRDLVVSDTGLIHEAVMAELEAPGGGELPLSADDVVLITRSTGGAGLALAQVLACCEAQVAVIGRAGSHDDSQLVRGLEQLRSAGARVGYEVIDLSDQAALVAAVQRIEDRFGPVTAIGHAASVDDLVPFHDLTDEDLAARVADEIGTLDRLIDAVGPDQLKMIITMSGLASRYGQSGASHVALAGGAMASRGAEHAASAHCKAIHLDMPAWANDGVGQPEGMAAQLAAIDVEPVDINAASRKLLKIITTPGLPQRLAVHGRVGGLPIALPPTLTAAELAAAGLPEGGWFLREVTVHYPGTEIVLEASLSLASDPYLADYQVDGMHVFPPVLALEALAEAASVLAGAPLRHANAIAMDSPIVVPSRGEAELRICALRAGNRIFTALRTAESSYATDHVRAEFACDQGQAVMPEVDAALESGTLAPIGEPGIVDGIELYGPIWFQAGRFCRIALLPEITARSAYALARGADDQPWSAPDSGRPSTFLLGSPGLNDAALQLLQACVPHRRLRPAGCASAQFSGRVADGPVEIRATAVDSQGRSAHSGSRADGVGAEGSAGSAAGRTGNQDAQARKPQRGSWRLHAASGREPDSIRPDVPGAHVRVLPAVDQGEQWTSAISVPQLWDVEAVDGAGPLAVWKGVAMRDCGPLPRTSAWPPALLSVYLERCAAELGCGPDLRVIVSSGLPEDAAPPELGDTVSTQAPPAAALQPVRPVEVPHETPQVVVPQQSPPVDSAAPRLWRQPRHVPKHAASSRLGSSVRLGYRRLGSQGSARDHGRALVEAEMQDDAQLTLAQPSAQASGGYTVSSAPADGTSPLAGFGLTVHAAVPVACGWIPVDEDRSQPLPTGMAHAFAQLRTGLSEPPGTLMARLEAISACVRMAGLAEEVRPVEARTTPDGWAVIDTRLACVATAIVEISGVRGPVAIGVLTRKVAGPHEPLAAPQAAPGRDVVPVR
ncbi:MAG TPA: SDR family NAD(P)-dependent oxidoreductase, partial [Streptosporangiaceae bacterium]|nr:SDR family NAD(P)-dependent oxidoreductase [Streptosporangiaceae bacterium]